LHFCKIVNIKLEDRRRAPRSARLVQPGRPELRRQPRAAGDGEFIGTDREDGSDAEQRADAQRVYREIIDQVVGLVKRMANTVGFTILPRRWVVERTLAWLNPDSRLAKDFEASIASAQAWVYIASMQLLIRRIAYQHST
jgi:putative transposase